MKAESGKAKAASATPAQPAKGKPAAKAAVKVAPAAVMPVKKDPTPAKTSVKPAQSKPVPVKAVVSAKSLQAPVKAQTKESVKVTSDKVAAVQAPVPVSIPSPMAAVPPRAGRPSSRLAQLTVPSMAQSVASTAAKASYTQTIPAPLIVPPLASAIKKDPKLANNWKTKPLAQLTDADLMAMPDEAYMNAVQLAYFRSKLVSLKLEIQSNAVDTTEHLREDTVVVPDPADRATIEEEHALELRTRDRERKLLKKIEQSIMRIDSGDYGYCDETGESIGVGRLLARPTATLSLEAQQRRELKQKMFGD